MNTTDSLRDNAPDTPPAATPENMPKDGNQNWGKKTINNVFWSYLSFFLGKGLTFVATVILARILSPDDFGLLGFCLVGLQYLDIVSRFGLDSALISRRDRIDEASNTILALSIVTGVLMYAAAWVGAPILADFFNAEAITLLFRVLALDLLIESFSIVHSAQLARSLRFREKLVPDLGKAVIKGGVSIAMALTGFGVWSLVWGQLAGSIYTLIAVWVLVPWRPHFRRTDNKTAREVITYGLHMIMVEIVGALRSNVDYLFVGRILGAAALGVYTIAYRIPELVIRSINKVVGTVAHPVMSQIQDNQAHIRAYYANYVRYVALFTIPAGVGIAVTAQPFVVAFYTDRWLDSIFPMQCIAIALAISSVGFIPGVLYKAINRPDILNRTSLIKLPVLLVVLWYSTRFGLEGVAIAQVFLACFYLIVDSFVVSRVFKFSMLEMVRAILPAVVCSITMAIAAGGASTFIPWDNLIELALLIMIGLAAYAITLRIVFHSIFDEMLGTAKSYRTKRKVKHA